MSYMYIAMNAYAGTCVYEARSLIFIYFHDSYPESTIGPVCATGLLLRLRSTIEA